MSVECGRAGCPRPIDGTGWLADDGPLCQEHWEADCAESFWEFALTLPASTETRP